MSRKAPRYHPLNQSRLYAIGSRPRLARLFGLNRQTLALAVADERAYTRRTIELTRNGKTKTRSIQEPRGVRRQIHAVVRTALARIEPPDSLFCPVRGDRMSPTPSNISMLGMYAHSISLTISCRSQGSGSPGSSGK
jgi:hypothetical protein